MYFTSVALWVYIITSLCALNNEQPCPKTCSTHSCVWYHWLSKVLLPSVGVKFTKTLEHIFYYVESAIYSYCNSCLCIIVWMHEMNAYNLVQQIPSGPDRFNYSVHVQDCTYETCTYKIHMHYKEPKSLWRSIKTSIINIFNKKITHS